MKSLDKDRFVSISLLGDNPNSVSDVNDSLSLLSGLAVDFLHIDVMDGSFVPNTTIWNDSNSLSKIDSQTPLDVHLMISNPVDRFSEFVLPSVARIAVHSESVSDFSMIKKVAFENNIELGVVLNPESSVDSLLSSASFADFFLVMSVNPGFAGQKFVNETFSKIRLIHSRFPDIPISVDGGVNSLNARELFSLGVSTLVIGSSFFRSPDKKLFIESLFSD